MRLLSILAAILVGLLGGAALTALVARDGIVFDRRNIGGWVIAPRIGSELIDPYARARMLVSGELPLANGEGFSLTAEQDRDREPLDGRCTYRLWGAMPAARFWTLTLTTLNGRPIITPIQRTGFTSGEIIRNGDGSFAMEIGPSPLPGNWLPSPDNGRYMLTLRFYETPLSATATLLEPRMLPELRRESCPS
ncbi:MAG: DUF1214 domain-containing protein [Rhabdaerophilum sp.]